MPDGRASRLCGHRGVIPDAYGSTVHDRGRPGCESLAERCRRLDSCGASGGNVGRDAGHQAH